MRKIGSFILGLGFILSSGGCASSLKDRYTTGAINDSRFRMRAAPIIFVGVVEALKRIGEPKPAIHVQDLTLQLYKARCRVELPLRGELPHRLDFWYFGPHPKDGLVGTPKFWLQPNERRIFFLESQGNMYRAVGDYLDYTERVHSGKPDGKILTSERDVGKVIASVMLTPRSDLDERLFSGDLFYASRVADEFSSPAYSVELLKRLVTHRSPLIRNSSCRILDSFYNERSDACPGAAAGHR